MKKSKKKVCGSLFQVYLLLVYIFNMEEAMEATTTIPTPRKLLTFIAGHSAVNLTGSLRVWPQVLVGRSQRLK